MGQPQQKPYSHESHQLSLRLEEPSLYHDTSAPDGTAFFALLTRKDRDSRSHQRCYPVSAMPLVLDQLDATADTWISQAEFFAFTRRLVHFKQVGLVWADLDTYKEKALQDLRPDQLLARLLATCPKVGLPEPSVVVFSGRGLQVKWILDGPLPRRALPRWNLVQAELCSRLAELGADPKARDGARVLRLVNTTNTSSGEVVRVIHAPLHKYSFDKLADAVLPFTRAQLDEMRARRAVSEQGELQLIKGEAQANGKRRRVGQLTDASLNGNLRPFVGSQLAWDRLDDLRKLAALRGYAHGAPDGLRDSFVFLGSAFLAQSLIYVPRFQDEVRQLARDFAPGWSAARVGSATSAVLDRLKQSLAGETVEYDGRRIDPRYRFKNDTLIDWLHITPTEQQQLATIVSKDEARRRDAERKRAARKAAGAVERAAYEGQAEQRRAAARLLHAQGKSQRAIAAELGVSVGAVNGYLRAE